MVDQQGALETLQLFAGFLEQEFQLSPEQIAQALSHKSIPATIFSEDATPLESIISYLDSQEEDATTIAKLLGRNSNYVKQVLERGKRHAEPTTTQYRIPVAALKRTAGPAVATSLKRQGLDANGIAQMMHKSPSTVRTWLRRGERYA